MTTRDDLEQITASLYLQTCDLVGFVLANPVLAREEAAVIHATYTKLAIVLDALGLIPDAPTGQAAKPRRVA